MRKIGCCFAPGEMEWGEYLDMIKAIGFESVFTGDSGDAIEAVQAKGIEVDNIHAPFDGINHMWFEGMSGETMLSRLKNSVDLCAEYNIPKTIIHLSSGVNSPHINNIGVSRFDKLIDHAVKKGVSLAFENQRKLANIAYIFERYDDVKEVGFCWDVGHEACFAGGREYMPLFGHKMIALHLQDNHCEFDRDQHLIPFDGKIDMQKTADFINNSPYDGTVMLEIFRRPASYTGFDGYENITLEEYYKRAYAAAVKFRGMLTR